MTLLKSFTLRASLALAVSLVSLTMVQAKQKLDQPALLAADALKPVAEVKEYIPDYIAVGDDGRLFAEFSRYNTNIGPALAIIQHDNSIIPYPGGTWNEWNKSAQNRDPANSFIGLDGMTMTQDEKLWVLDSGIDKTSNTMVKNGAKIVEIDTKTNKVVKTHPIPSSVLRDKTILNAIAVYNNHAYIADRGAPALIIFELNTGQARRVLENSSTLYSRNAIVVDGQTLRPSLDQNSRFNVNQLAISPDGKRLYYQAVSGPLYRIDTMYLNDPTYSEAELNEAMMLWFKTPSSGGIVCGPDGTLYFDDIATNSVYRFTTGRILNKLITDPRLKWPGHPFVTKNNVLYIPTTQLNQTKLFNKQDHSTIQWPLPIYSLTPPPLKN
ncbi:L-dopachrome tautomerase-related protein [Commensalibacter oyaizuii]|uniref:L-dopachrome tautomerase-related protein n=1 Tax=Commensalibacter oyaizuii TaxID=3043873 RepID=A0ABT6PYR4_9PROT|nr:L-dopachrome tautomerase-related protein [Commensalibacter sp. TBRC 16381]MDI2090002.1 L-dopachrome tautomerase-related protein [Commensalibacter sp. TBRC 16381]